MLTRLELTNFKAWRESGEIGLAPLTVLFGSNSAGKTSIPQLLLLLKQTAASPDRKSALQLGDSRTLVDVGTFEDAVHGRDLSIPVEFTIGWSLERKLDIVDPLSNRHFVGDELHFSARFEADERRQPRVTFFRYELRKAREIVLDLELREEKRGSGEFQLASERYALVRRRGRAWPLPGPVRYYGFPDEVAAYYQNAAFAADLVLELERCLRQIYHVGPLRESPRRLYLWSGEVPEHVGARGERTIEALLAAADRSINFRPKAKARPLPQLVAERLRQMGLIKAFKVQPLGEHRKEYEVLVQTSGKLPPVKLTDVGFGISQVLPVIVESFYVPPHSVVIFEQPEIHLHPQVQAALADLFVDAIRARERGEPRNCQFIVESHSEHFLRRLQRRIAEEELGRDDAALYFVDTGGGTARLDELEVDDFGNISNWPEGFFGDEMEDLVARAEAQARRMQSR